MSTPRQESPDAAPVEGSVRVATAPSTNAPDEGPRARLVFRLSMAVAVLPIFVAAVRDGLNGWYPTLDAATTVLRTRDVLTAHPPLVGMWASVSQTTGVATYFPGAIQMYVLAIPVHVLGNSWGTLLGMALLNSTWVLLATWLIGRRVGPQLATVGCLAFAALVWTMGSELVVDISPMQMVTIPFALFLIAVWSVADGDLVAVPVLALVANFLVLGHLVLTLLVPLIGICAPIGLFLALRRRRREEPETWPGDRRRLVRVLVLSAAITVLCWLAPIYQQLTDQPGNLTNLWRASQADLRASLGYGKAIQVVVSILTVPPFWLRHSFTTETISSAPRLNGVQTLLGLGLVALFALLTVLAVRRRDRTVVTMLAVAGVTLVASVVNITKAPSTYGFKRQYFRSLWGMSLFIWMTLAIAALRSVLGTSRRSWLPRVGYTFAGLTALVALLALPHSNPGPGTNGTTDPAAVLARKTLGPAVAALEGKGKVMVVPDGPFASYSITTGLILALATAGVDVCVPASWVDQFGDSRACGAKGPDVVAAVSTQVRPVSPGTKVIAEASALSAEEQRELTALTDEVSAWLASRDSLSLDPSVRAVLVANLGAKRVAEFEAAHLARPDGRLQELVNDPSFAMFVAKSTRTGADGSTVAPIETGSLPAKDLLRWATLDDKADNGYSTRIAVRVVHPR